MYNIIVQLWKNSGGLTAGQYDEYRENHEAVRKCNESNTNGASQPLDNELHQWVLDNLLMSTPKWLKDRISKDFTTLDTSVWLLGKHIGPNGFIGILHSLF